MTAFHINCCVPGCHRTTRRNSGGEWICGRHWSRVPDATRRVFHRAGRKGKCASALDRLWSRCKREAGDAFQDFVQ